jgi:hypothetical protein
MRFAFPTTPGQPDGGAKLTLMLCRNGNAFR